MAKLTIIAAEMILASAITAILYGIDKQAARAGRRRIPENVLLIGCLLGGWPGAWLTGQVIRHKTSKLSYRLWFAAATISHLLILLAMILWL